MFLASEQRTFKHRTLRVLFQKNGPVSNIECCVLPQNSGPSDIECCVLPQNSGPSDIECFVLPQNSGPSDIECCVLPQNSGPSDTECCVSYLRTAGQIFKLVLCVLSWNCESDFSNTESLIVCLAFELRMVLVTDLMTCFALTMHRHCH